MKNVVILHGTSETKDSFWYPWITAELEKRGYSVSIPKLPDADEPDIHKWLPDALQETYTEETILIGHSAGCPLMLAVLEQLERPIAQAIFVAAYFENVNPVTGILKPTYDWDTIRGNAHDRIIINSDNDPWHCDEQQARKLFAHIGGTMIIRSGEGHMGSDMYHQPYKEFPFLLSLIK